jgi:hypothetical protein
MGGPGARVLHAAQEGIFADGAWPASGGRLEGAETQGGCMLFGVIAVSYEYGMGFELFE